MGRSGNWIKSLISLKKNQSNDTEKSVGKGRKWKLWRSASGGIAMTSSKSVKGVGNFGDSEGSEASFLSDNGFAAAMAAVVRAPHKDFIIVKQEWAALRIQAMFRAFLARRALRALKAVVRLQAIVRGRLVRKQAAMTLKCMQALVRVQARVRAQCNQTSLEENALNSDPIKSGWCDSPGTVDEVRSKFKMRQLGAIKRERAIAYAQQRNPSPKTQNKGRSNGDGSWLERWMAYKPWEDHTERSSVSIRRNNVSTRISAREPISCRIEYPYDDSTSSYSSSVSNSEEGQSKKPNYMNPTESIKAKKVQQRNTNYSNQSMQRHSTDSLQIHRKSSPVSRAIARRSAECDLYSVVLC